MLESFLLSSFLISQSSIAEPKFLALKNQLEKFGFQVIIALPPLKHSPQQNIGGNPPLPRPYGLLESSKKIIWINPVVFDLQIATQTLIHESVHAAQVCAGGGKLKTLGLDIQPINYARPFFLRYADVHRQDLEREAYAVQTQPNSFELATSLLQQNCK
ncbi:hypothetical protein IQ238_08560 [Pleurocapsales cyanobacterium LEGE 06147]|nr:hypothetical protein [Pleurocapsales cyanobacterium LEGE 06147]